MNSSATQGHGFISRLALGPVVFPSEGDAPIIQRQQARVGDRHPMGVADR